MLCKIRTVSGEKKTVYLVKNTKLHSSHGKIFTPYLQRFVTLRIILVKCSDLDEQNVSITDAVNSLLQVLF